MIFIGDSTFLINSIKTDLHILELIELTTLNNVVMEVKNELGVNIAVRTWYKDS